MKYLIVETHIMGASLIANCKVKLCPLFQSDCEDVEMDSYEFIKVLTFLIFHLTIGKMYWILLFFSLAVQNTICLHEITSLDKGQMNVRHKKIILMHIMNILYSTLAHGLKFFNFTVLTLEHISYGSILTV